MLLRSLNSIHHIIFPFVIQVRLAKRSLVYYFWRWCCRCTSLSSCSNCWSGINCMLVDFPPKGHTNQNSIQSPSSLEYIKHMLQHQKLMTLFSFFWYAPCKCSPREEAFFHSKTLAGPVHFHRYFYYRPGQSINTIFFYSSYHKSKLDSKAAAVVWQVPSKLDKKA